MSSLVNWDIIETLEEEGVDPIRVLAKFAKGDMGDEAAQLSAAKELAAYVYPKKRSLDVNKEIKASVSYQIVNFKDVMPDEAEVLSGLLNQEEVRPLITTQRVKEIKARMKKEGPLDYNTIELGRRSMEKYVKEQDAEKVLEPLSTEFTKVDDDEQ
jgi:hypothetical protein